MSPSPPLRRRCRTALLVGALVGAALPLPAQAADATKPLNAQQPPPPLKPLDDARQEAFALPAIAAPAPAKPAESRSETLVLQRIRFKGNSAIPTADLDKLAQPYAGKIVGIEELEELCQKLTKHYIDRGYINSGSFLGRKAIEGDTLTVDIVEGRLQTIRLHGLQRLHEDYVVSRLVDNADAPLNVEQLRERFQLLLGDPHFERLNARLMPDAKLGEALLDIDVTRARPYQLTVFANNYRPPSIGEKTYGLSGWVRNLTGRGDLLEATRQDSTKNDDGGRTNLTWQMPVSRDTQLSLQFDRGRSSVIEEPMQVLDIKSILKSKDVGLSQTLNETLNRKLAIGINRVWRENRTTLLGAPFSFVPGEPDGVTKARSWRFWQEYANRSEKRALALRSTFSVVSNNLEDIAALPNSSALAAHRYTTWLGQAQYARQVLDNGAQVVVRGTVQHAWQHLLALDQLSVGGVGTVRGFRENQMIRDVGTIVNFEFDYPVVRNPGKGLNFSLIPFVDGAYARNQNETGDSLSSVGIATRLRWQGFNFDLAVARRLSHPDAVDSLHGSLQDDAIHLQLSYNFFGY